MCIHARACPHQTITRGEGLTSGLDYRACQSDFRGCPQWLAWEGKMGERAELVSAAEPSAPAVTPESEAGLRREMVAVRGPVWSFSLRVARLPAPLLQTAALRHVGQMLPLLPALQVCHKRKLGRCLVFLDVRDLDAVAGEDDASAPVVEVILSTQTLSEVSEMPRTCDARMLERLLWEQLRAQYSATTKCVERVRRCTRLTGTVVNRTLPIPCLTRHMHNGLMHARL